MGKMTALVRYLIAVCLVLAAVVLAVTLIDPPEPVMLIDAAPARADVNAPHLFAPCPLSPAVFPPPKPTIVRT